ncbi:hypothetical protein CSQ85_12800 [Bifidobacterium rousetti]|uniref:hypothetical protein n=1 Tax=Bifidobacterium rousetti TaxID=2045439 RepID=UPI001239BCC6|nr:hypothetical protein [Bifidobacterium rousetti]KAA8815253.1 hypothetical protein CSQ85_12800 [Bifidobacterium rousetti]
MNMYAYDITTPRHLVVGIQADNETEADRLFKQAWWDSGFRHECRNRMNALQQPDTEWEPCGWVGLGPTNPRTPTGTPTGGSCVDIDLTREAREAADHATQPRTPDTYAFAVTVTRTVIIGITADNDLDAEQRFQEAWNDPHTHLKEKATLLAEKQEPDADWEPQGKTRPDDTDHDLTNLTNTMKEHTR